MREPEVDQDFREFVRSFRLHEYKDALQRLSDHGLPTTAVSYDVQDELQSPFDGALLPAPDHFVGRRDELEWLLNRLRQGSAAGVTALNGIGGIGKTALVAVAIREMKAENRYRDGIVVILCQNEADPAHVLRAALARFDPERHQPDATDIANLAEIAQRLLAGKDALIVLDNIEPDLAEQLDKVTVPLRSAGAVLLLTSRQQLSRDVVSPVGSRELKELSNDEAGELFAQSCGVLALSSMTRIDQDAIKRIVAVLGRHTLAVKLVAAYAADLHRPLSILANELEMDPLRVPGDAGERVVSLVFKESIDQLSTDGQRLFAALSVFKTSQFGRGAVLALASSLRLKEQEPALALLVRRALLDPSFDNNMHDGSDRERFTIHPLLRAYAAEQFAQWSSDDQRTAYQAITAFYADYVQSIEQLKIDDTSLQPDAANIVGALEWATSNQQQRFTADLCYGMRNYWLNRWHTGDILQWMSWSVEAVDGAVSAQEYAKDKEAVRRLADVALTYGRVLRRTGELDEARKILQNNLAIRRRIADRTGEAAVLQQLGRVEQYQARLKDAMEHFQESYNIFVATGDQRNAAASIGYLGRIAQARGQLPRAEQLFRESLRIARAEQDLRGEAAVLSSLGQLGLARGAYDDAERYLRQSLDIRRRIFDQQGESEALSQLGRLALDRGQFDLADQYFQESLQIDQKVQDHPGAGVDLSQLALVALEAGDLDKAESLLDKSLPVRRRVGDLRGEGVDLALLGRIALNRGQLARAEEYYTKSLALARDVQNRRGEGVNLRQLASIYEQRKEFDTAEQYYREALKIAMDVDNGLDIADSLLALGRFLIVNRYDRDHGCPMISEAIDRYNRMGVPGAKTAYDTARRHGCSV